MSEEERLRSPFSDRPTEARLLAEDYGGETPGFTDETDGGVRHVAMYGRDRAEHFGGETPSFTDEADGGVRHVAMCGRDRAEPFGGETPSFTDETDGGVRHVAMCGRDQAEHLESRLLIFRTKPMGCGRTCTTCSNGTGGRAFRMRLVEKTP